MRRRRRVMLRSASAVLLGYVALSACVAGMQFVLRALVPAAFDFEAMNWRSSWGLVVVGTGFLAAVCGGFVTAKAAGRSPLLHANLLAGIVLLFGILYMAFTPPEMSLLYQLSVHVSGVLGVVLGGVLAEWSQSRSRRPGEP